VRETTDPFRMRDPEEAAREVEPQTKERPRKSGESLGTKNIWVAGKASSPPAPVLANEAELYILRRHGPLYSRPPTSGLGCKFTTCR
jgi:hypothetical protein